MARGGTRTDCCTLRGLGSGALLLTTGSLQALRILPAGLSAGVLLSAGLSADIRSSRGPGSLSGLASLCCGRLACGVSGCCLCILARDRLWGLQARAHDAIGELHGELEGR